jgi:hypothetical protein
MSTRAIRASRGDTSVSKEEGDGERGDKRCAHLKSHGISYEGRPTLDGGEAEPQLWVVRELNGRLPCLARYFDEHRAPLIRMVEPQLPA